MLVTFTNALKFKSLESGSQMPSSALTGPWGSLCLPPGLCSVPRGLATDEECDLIPQGGQLLKTSRISIFRVLIDRKIQWPTVPSVYAELSL